MADGTLVGPTTWVKCGGGGGDGGGIGRWLFLGGGDSGGKFPVAGFVAAECLVRQKSLVAYAAFVGKNLIL